MRLFLQRVISFGLVVMTVMFVMEKLLETKTDEYSEKHDYLERHLNDIKILSLGHSHIADGINMIVLDDSGYNAAIPARAMFYDKCIVEEFVPRMPNLKTLIVPLGYNFQYISEIDNSQKFNMKKYWGYTWPGDIPWMPVFEIVGGSKSKVMRLLGIIKDFESSYDSLGHQHLLKKNRPQKGWDKVNSPKLKGDIKTKSKFIRLVKDIAAVCRRHRIRLIMVSAPTFDTYYSETTPQGRAELYEIVDSMRSVYPEVEYYNFFNDSRFVADDFYDSSHLNEDGALKFTGILKEEVLPTKRPGKSTTYSR